jgi:predicted DNA-binding transcriptional regulator YafY
VNQVLSVKQTIITAIKARRALSFVYNGRKRTVRPQCFGLGAKGTELLRGHQISGGAQPEPLFDVSRISDLVMLDEQFSRPGPNYKRNDSAMKTIFAEL